MAFSPFFVPVFSLLLSVNLQAGVAAEPPLVGLSLLNDFNCTDFTDGYTNFWGLQHQFVSENGSSVSLLLDASSGSGFKSKEAYIHGLFNAAIKLPRGYTAGVITSFYLSNAPVFSLHDELDIEFLGTVPGKPYKLQTNIYMNGSGDGPTPIGREEQFVLWFDPTLNFHNYSIIWTSNQILWLVDGIPIRQFQRVNGMPGVVFPARAMSIYATTWNTSSWAVEGNFRTNFTYAPFISTYSNFITEACPSPPQSVNIVETCPALQMLQSLMSPFGLTPLQRETMAFVRKQYMVYDYCQDFVRYPKGTMPECSY